VQLSRDKQLAKGQDADPVAVYTLKHSIYPQTFSLHIVSTLKHSLYTLSTRSLSTL
jgi:hypothetical protein